MRRVLVVGGVAGGATAAARLRRLDENAEIIIFERGSAISYANCGLPYHLGNVIDSRDKLLLQTKEGFWERFKVEVRLQQEVLSIDRKAKSIRIQDKQNSAEYEESYDYLILSPGAKPRLPKADVEAEAFIHALHTLEDMDAILAGMKATHVEHVVVMGGGYVALETAENLLELGIKTTLIQRSNKLLPPFDAEMLAPLYSELKHKGLCVRLNAPVSHITCQDNRVRLVCSNGEPIACDLVVAAIGVEPASRLAADCGLAVSERGGILVDKHMRSSDPAIFAVGDAVQVTEFVSKTPAQIALAGPANKQARIAANTICGLDSAYNDTQGSSIIKMFDLTAAVTGINEKTALSLGLNYDKVYLFAQSHAGYYPQAQDMMIKVLFEKPTGKILGAQLLGREGIDKRADILAVAIRAQMTAADLCELELCYAPPYSSAKDPVNVVGLMITNLLDGQIAQFHWHDVKGLPQDGSALLLDVRTPQEYQSGKLEGFVNYPVDTLRARLGELDKTKPVYLHCQSGLRSYVAARILMGHGFSVSHLCGGYKLYEQALATLA